LCQQLPSPASTFLAFELISESGLRGKWVSCFNASQIAGFGCDLSGTQFSAYLG